MNTPTAPLHLLAKPTGATCNLDCKYCFFLSKESLYPNERTRMSAETLESYIRQLLAPQDAAEVTIAWQGGDHWNEPFCMATAYDNMLFAANLIAIEQRDRTCGGGCGDGQLHQ